MDFFVENSENVQAYGLGEGTTKIWKKSADYGQK